MNEHSEILMEELTGRIVSLSAGLGVCRAKWSSSGEPHVGIKQFVTVLFAIWQEMESGQESPLLAKEKIAREAAERLKKEVSAEDLRKVLTEGAWNIFDEQAFFVDTSKGIADLALAYLDIKAKDKVLDMCAGTGSFLLRAQGREPKAKYQGIENLADNVKTAWYRGLANGKKLNILEGNALLKDFDVGKVNKIFIDPPRLFETNNLYCENSCEGTKNSALKAFMDEYYWQKKFSLNTTWLFALAALNYLADDFRMVMVVPNADLYHPETKLFRRYFAERGLVEAIIALPNYLCGYSDRMKINLVLFTRGDENRKIKFLDASDLKLVKGKKQAFLPEGMAGDIYSQLIDGTGSLPMEEITPDELRAFHYTFDYTTLQLDLLDKFGRFPFLPLSRLTKSIKLGKRFDRTALSDLITDADTDFYYMTQKDITDDGLADLDNMTRLREIDRDDFQTYGISEAGIVLAKSTAVGTTFKMAFVERKENEKIIIDSNLCIIEPDAEAINPIYLFLALKNQFSLRQMNVMFSRGNSLTVNLRTGILGWLRIVVPSREMQDKIADEYREWLATVKLAKSLREELAQKVDGFSLLQGRKEKGGPEHGRRTV